jgi:hypothetical protein
VPDDYGLLRIISMSERAGLLGGELKVANKVEKVSTPVRSKVFLRESSAAFDGFVSGLHGFQSKVTPLSL